MIWTDIFSIKQRLGFIIASLLGMSLVYTGANAAQLLFDGDFETGAFQGWTAGGENGGVAFPAGEGTCFSADDTTGIQLAGNYAGLVRSGPEGRKDSFGTLTSDPFTAGDGIAFLALSETRDGKTIRAPVNFFVRILNANNEPLVEHKLNTAVARLARDCPSRPRTAAFSAHFVDTHQFSGRDIKVQFRQSTNVGGEGFFTLVDQVVMFGDGERPIFTTKPVAVAGTSFSSGGTLQLDGSRSFDPDDQNLTYRWFIDDEFTPREGRTECIGDLPGGEYTVTLYVSDGYSTIGDTMLLGVPSNSSGSGGSTTTANTNNNNNNADANDNNNNNNADANNNNNNDNNNTSSNTGNDPTCDEPDDNANNNNNNNDNGNTNENNNNTNNNNTGNGDNNTNNNNVVTGSPPTLDLDGNSPGADFATIWTFGFGGVTVVDTDVTVTDPDSTMLSSATVTISNPQILNGIGDELLISGALPAGITRSSTSDANVVLLTGNAPISDYESALQQIQFNNGNLVSTEIDTTIVRNINVEIRDDQNNAASARTSITLTTL